ncbi:hypothetical protein HK405_001405, partial [Cladochytrium tenue]
LITQLRCIARTPLDAHRVSTPLGLFADLANYARRCLVRVPADGWAALHTALANRSVLAAVADAAASCDATVSERAAAACLLAAMVVPPNDAAAHALLPVARARAAAAWRGPGWLRDV